MTRKLHSKSCSSIKHITSPILLKNHVCDKNHKGTIDYSLLQAVYGNFNEKQPLSKNSLATVEKLYLKLQKDSDLSKNSVSHSSSTVYYDIDDAARKNSFECFSDISNNSVLIVQGCATEYPPTMLRYNSRQNSTKKVNDNLVLSSEIILRDENRNESYINQYYKTQVIDNDRKYWPYTKCISTESKNKGEKRCKNKEAHCVSQQLSSSRCPCAGEKSYVELTKNKTLTVNQFTGAKKLSKLKRLPFWFACKDNKKINTNAVQIVDVGIPESQTAILICPKENTMTNTSLIEFSRNKSQRKRQVQCPYCKENVKIVSSDDVASIKDNINALHSKEVLRKPALDDSENSNESNNDSEVDGDCDDKDDDKHNSQHFCDDCKRNTSNYLVVTPPPSSESRSVKFAKISQGKSNSKIIRITKACRHHPPCTVVPSCQKTRVLKSNCGFIPPCLHHPRCVNIPLCVPSCKNIYYCDPFKKKSGVIGEDQDTHIMRCNMVPVCEFKTTSQRAINNSNNPKSIFGQVQNLYEFSCSKTPALDPESQLYPVTLSQFQQSLPYVMLDKSCQYFYSKTKIDSPIPNKRTSSDAVIFVRDVGCQFVNESHMQFHPSQKYESILNLDRKIDAYYNYAGDNKIRFRKLYISMSKDSLSSLINFRNQSLETQNPTHRKNGTNTKFNETLLSESLSACTSPKLNGNLTNEDSSRPETAGQKNYTNHPYKIRKKNVKGRKKSIIMKHKSKLISNSISNCSHKPMYR